MNKKKIIICGIVLVILISIVCVFFIGNNKSSENNSLSKERMIELVDNSYKYYLLKEGHINLGNDIVEIDDITYYSVEEEWLKSIDDINFLIEDTYTSVREVSMHNDLFDNRQILEHNDKLYMSMSEEGCIVDYEINKDDLTYTKEDDDTILIEMGILQIYAYYEDDKWQISSNVYDCSLQNIVS